MNVICNKKQKLFSRKRVRKCERMRIYGKKQQQKVSVAPSSRFFFTKSSFEILKVKKKSGSSWSPRKKKNQETMPPPFIPQLAPFPGADEGKIIVLSRA